MSMINTELYDAQRSANVPEPKARKAAETIPGQDQVATKEDMTELKATTKVDIAKLEAEIKAELSVLKWMVGVNMVLTLGLIWQSMG